MTGPKSRVSAIARDADLALIRAYLEHARQSGLAQLSRYCRNRSLIRLAAWLPVPLIEATDDHLADWRAHLRLCNQSINNYVTDARMFYAWAVTRGLRSDNAQSLGPGQ
jgi:hypothetical protein